MDLISDIRRRLYDGINAWTPRSDDRFAALTARHIQMPLKEPFETAARRATASDSLLVELTTESGTTGLGAATPVHYVTGETIPSVIEAVNNAANLIVGRRVSDYLHVVGELKALMPDSPGARAAMEIALVDLVGKIANQPVFELLGGKPREIETDITIPVVPPDHAAELALHAYNDGFRMFKVKVGKDTDEDSQRVRSIAQAVPEASFILDGNEGFTPEAAVKFIRSLDQNVLVFEQPVKRSDIEGLTYVTENIDVPVFADESVHNVEDVIRLAENRAVSGVNVKLMKSGFFGALEIAWACRALGLELMLGCMLEPRVSISAAIHLSCAVPEFKHFDLDADLLLAGEARGCFTRKGACLKPLITSGLGCNLEWKV